LVAKCPKIWAIHTSGIIFFEFCFLSSRILNIGSQISIFGISFSKWFPIKDLGAIFIVNFDSKKDKSESGSIHRVESNFFSQPLSPALQSSSPDREQNCEGFFSPLLGGVSRSDEGVVCIAPTFLNLEIKNQPVC
jgi:hypothetical protein